ncbi:hypothetical protein JCM10908_000979 [Rhodotorula pacifica]|uniref:uncharacterized protein n=1 Tax=Rhodotorula pacifica TaxID=1495444 RepID=UPI00318243F0
MSSASLVQLVVEDAVDGLQTLREDSNYHSQDGGERFDLDAAAADIVEPLYGMSSTRTRLLEMADTNTVAALSEQDIAKIGSDALAAIYRESNLPFRDTLNLVKDLNKSERAAAARGRKDGHQMLKEVYVHLMSGEDATAASQARGKRVWTTSDGVSRDLPPTNLGERDLLIHPRIPRLNHPATTVILDRDLVLSSDRLSWLARRPVPEAALSASELKRLDLRTLSSQGEIASILVIRGEVGIDAAWLAEARRARESIEKGLKVCRRINRGKERAAVGDATGAGFRKDQRGRIGLYRNFKTSLPSFAALHAFQSRQRRLTDHLLGVGEVLVPGYVETLRTDSARLGFPLTNHAGVAGTVNLMRGWDAPQHVESADDAALTGAISYGSPDAAHAGSADFCLSSVNEGKGLVVASGPGSVIWFNGARNVHGTARQLASGAEQEGRSESFENDFDDVTELLDLGVLCILDEAARSRLANIKADSTPAPPLPAALPERALPNAQQFRGVCFYQKEGLLSFQERRNFDLEQKLTEEAQMTTRWTSLAPSSNSADTAASPLAPGISARRPPRKPNPLEKDVPIESKGVAPLAFARYQGNTAEVASALSASVSRGVLMELVRKTAADLDSDKPESTAEFIDALFNVLTYINVHQAIGQTVIDDGIVNVLVDFVKISSRDHLQMIAANKAVVVLDGFLAVEEHREEAEKLEATVVENSTGLLSFPQGSVLKSILRATHRLMTTSGTTEGLHNLIDTSLLASVKKVMENRFTFGPQVFALVTNIAATFVHNEPTSLTMLQEAKVPDALYDSLERAIPASNDVLQAIPNAIGAFCLDQAGLEHFLTRDLISKYFAVFNSPAHYELLRDRDSAVNLGAAVDELVRHHPTLKVKILDAIFDIFVEFKRMGAGYVPPASESGYNLQPPTAAGAAGASEDVAMQEGAAPATAEAMAEGSEEAKDKKKAEDENTEDNEVTNAIDVFGRFLEGLFQNNGHTQDFIEHKSKPFDLLLDLLELPSSPAIMLKNGGYSSIVALFRISSEIKAAEALTAILGRIDKWLNETKWFWEPTASEDGDRKSTLAAMVHPSADDFRAQQKRSRDPTILLSHAATVIISVLTVKGPQSEILQRIGQVYHACLWENVTIRPTSFSSGEASKAATEQLAQNAPDGEAPTPAVAVARERQKTRAADVAAREVISTPATPDSPNVKPVQDVVQSFTRMALPLYQTIVKLLVHRRTYDA